VGVCHGEILALFASERKIFYNDIGLAVCGVISYKRRLI
jgi:hypothetical protein